jgi:BirA family biotin operon repressor/biotin-[acetyl-CoA-carboxylase] ligase
LATPYDIVRIGSVASTQDVARSTFLEAERPTLVLAERQTAGRGRMGRTWEQPDRAMFSSFSFGSQWAPSDQPLITLCTAVALAAAIESATDVASAIKWPNDLLVDGRKVAGILVESVDSVVTVGCGANLWWPRAPLPAAAIYAEDPGPNAAYEIAVLWVDRLRDILAEGPDAWPRDTYLARSWTMGREVTWDEGSGRAVGIDDRGGLIVATDGGEATITAGEVHVLEGR